MMTGELENVGARFIKGTPNLQGPIFNKEGVNLSVKGLPKQFRDFTGTRDDRGWAWVSSEGILQLQGVDGKLVTVLEKAVGDRIRLTDFDGDGDFEIVTTTTALLGELDQVQVRRVDRETQQWRVVFRRSMTMGSIASMAYVNPSDIPDAIFLVEEQPGFEASLWLLETR